MDIHFQNYLTQRGLNVKTGSDVTKSSDGDILVKYSDNWRWDLVMYLDVLQVTVYEGKSGDMLATSTWQNSGFFHVFSKADEIVAKCLGDVFTKIQVPKAAPPPPPPKKETPRYYN